MKNGKVDIWPKCPHVRTQAHKGYILLVCKRQVVCIGNHFSGAKREGPTGEHIAGGVHLRIVDLEVGRLYSKWLFSGTKGSNLIWNSFNLGTENNLLKQRLRTRDSFYNAV